MKHLLFLLSTCLLSSYGSFAQEQSEATTNKLTVHIQNIKSSEGKISVGIYNSSDTWLDRTYTGKTGEIIDGKATVVFDEIENGEYGISLYHDENDNGKLDTGMFGIPKEPYACSNGAKGRFGPPKWKDAVFVIENTDSEHIIKL